MSGYKRVNFYELCRLCASTKHDKTHIFEEVGRRQQLQTKIQSLLGVRIEEDDYLPKAICSSCVSHVETSYAFRQECINSESMLSTYFQNFRDTEVFRKSGEVYIRDTSPNRKILEAADISDPVRVDILCTPESQLVRQNNLVYIPQDSKSDVLKAIAVINVTNKPAAPSAPVTSLPEETYHHQQLQPSQPSDPLLSNELDFVKKPKKPPKKKLLAEHLVESALLAKAEKDERKSDLHTIAANWSSSSSSGGGGSDPFDHGSKSFECELCKRGFKRREHLYQHMKLHNGFRPFVCEHCNKSFMRKEHLMRHMASHLGLKNYACDICQKSFSRNDNLTKHKKIHEKVNNYVCELCNKHFIMKHYYLAHKLTHENERVTTASVWNTVKV